MITPVLSPQEIRLAELAAGRPDPILTRHERANRLVSKIKGAKPVIDVERALYFTQSMEETVGQPLVLRWAKALYHLAANITVYVTEDQLLLGRVGQPGRHGILYPELDGDFLDLAVASLPGRSYSPADISEKDARLVFEEISPFWKGKTYHEALSKSLPHEVFNLTYDDPLGHNSRFIVNETSSFRSSIQWVHDYEKVLQRGFKGVAAEARERQEDLDIYDPRDQAEKKPFYEAIITLTEAIYLWVRRNAKLAEEKAQNETDPIRRQEL